MQKNTSPKSNDFAPKQEPTEAGGQKGKLPRNPRWTTQDTVTLIQAKQVVDVRGSKCEMCSVFGLDRFEPKWDHVSSFCKQLGVNRGPVQCRKRWGNLVCDLRKIKTWESQVKGESESFWEIRSDLRKEKKLPGFFDREIYNLLDGGRYAVTAYPLRSVKEGPTKKNENKQNNNESVLGNKMLMIKEVSDGNSRREASSTPVANPCEFSSFEKKNARFRLISFQNIVHSCDFF